MGKFAARVLDVAGHGGFIVCGEPTVWIGGMQAARKGDPILCPMFDGPKPHVGGAITMGSTTVLIGGMPAARVGDLTGCNIIGLSGRAIPLLLGPEIVNPGLLSPTSSSPSPSHRKIVDNKKLYAEKEVTDSNKNGSFDASAGLISHQEEEYKDIGWFEFGTFKKAKIGYGDINLHAGIGKVEGTGMGMGGSLEAGALKEEKGFSIASAGSNGRNPYLSASVEANLLHAEAEADYLVGSDGEKSGFILKGGASAAVADVKGSATVTTPSIFGYNIQGNANASIAVGDIGTPISGGIWLYYDHSEGRLHVGASLGVIAEMIGGVDGEIGLSIGRKYQDPDKKNQPPDSTSFFTNIDFLTIPGFGAGGIPGTVTTGCPTVWIGG